MATASPTSPTAATGAADSTFAHLNRTRLFIAGAAAAGMGATLCHLLNVPLLPSLEGSLLLQGSPLVAVLTAAVTLVLGILVGLLLAGRVSHESGLFVGVLGWLALAYRGGPVTPVLFEHPTPATFLGLAGETAVLFALLGAGWGLLPTLQWFLRVGAPGSSQGGARGEVDPVPPAVEALLNEPSTPAQNLSAMLVCATVVVAMMLLLAQSAAKNQAVAATAIASLLGGVAAYYTFPTSSSLPVLLGPGVAAVAAYVVTFLAPVGQTIGFPQGLLGAAARALPIDYASAGVAGAIFGYWLARAWQQEHAGA